MNWITLSNKRLERAVFIRLPYGFRHILWITGLVAVVVIMRPPDIWGGNSAANQASLTRAEREVLHLAQEAMAERQHATAEKLLVAHIAAHPDGVHYLVDFTLGNVLALGGNPAAALDRYRSAAKRAPEDAAVWQNMGKACYDLQRYGAAGDSLARAHALALPPDPSLAYQAAVAYILAEKLATARPLLEALTTGNTKPPKMEWFEALLKVYVDLKMPERALELARKLTGWKGDSPRLWQALTHLYIKLEMYQEAAAAMEIYLALAPGAPEAVRQLGDLYHMAGIPLQAARRYETLLTHAAEPPLYEKTASAYIAARRTNKAMAILHRGLDRHPTARMWRLLATIHYQNEAFQKAYQAFEKSARIDSGNARTHLMMGYCALQNDRFNEARTAFERAARSPGLHAEANEMIEQIDSYVSVVAKREVIRTTRN